MLPATSYLHMVRETIVAMTPGDNFNGLNIEFENVKFLRATSLVPRKSVSLNVVIHRGSGQFEISEGQSGIVSGIVRTVRETVPVTEVSDEKLDAKCPTLEKKDFYKELRLRGYNYASIFQSVVEARADGERGKIRWNNNWPAFMDCLLQVNILAIDSRSLFLPTSIRKIRINTEAHLEAIAQLDPANPVLEVKMSRDLNTVVCGGIEVIGMSVNSVARRKPPGTEVVETYRFVPYNCDLSALDKQEAINVFIQIGQENLCKHKIKVVEIDSGTEPLMPLFDECIANTPLITAELSLLSQKTYEKLDNIAVSDAELETMTNCNYIIASGAAKSEEFMKQIAASLADDAFVIFREALSFLWNDSRAIDGFQLISLIKTDDEKLTLWRKMPKSEKNGKTIVKMSSKDPHFTWIEPLQEALRRDGSVFIVEEEPYSGIIGLVKCIRREPGGEKLCCVRIDDSKAAPFSADNPLYFDQLEQNLVINILQNGKWGTYRHLKLPLHERVTRSADHFHMNMKRLGDLTSAVWMSGTLDPKATKNVVRVQYSAINFRDVMLATGRLPPEMHSKERIRQQNILGLEYSGITASGAKVMGMVETGAMSTYVIPTDNLTWNVPDNMTLREAATIPAVYTTVYYAFFMYRPIEAGKSILIHAGSGGIGLAAIRVALAYGMTVYTTVSTDRKKQFILETFPQLKGKLSQTMKGFGN